jgi:hypothetical protein
MGGEEERQENFDLFCVRGKQVPISGDGRFLQDIGITRVLRLNYRGRRLLYQPEPPACSSSPRLDRHQLLA